MAETVYFQWQNEFLLNTIYPLRDMKLRDFLVFYYEIDIWAQYKDKTIQDIAPEVETYRKAQEALRQEMYTQYDAYRTYFITPDVTADFRNKYPNLDQPYMDKLNAMHALFARYFPTYNHPVKERYFVATRLAEIEKDYKYFERSIADRKRKLTNMGPTWKHKQRVEGELAQLQNVSIKMCEEELARLNAFLAALMKLEKRREEWAKWQKEQVKDQTEVSADMQKKQTAMAALEKQLADTVERLGWLQTPNLYQDLKTYFLKPDVTAEITREFPNLDAAFLAKINLAHTQTKQLPSHISAQKWFFDNLVRTYTANWKYVKDVAQQMAAAELLRMRQFSEAIAFEASTPDKRTALINQLQTTQKDLESKIAVLRQEMTMLDVQRKKIDSVLGLSEREQLNIAQGNTDITVRDVVRGKVEEYRSELQKMSSAQLLEAVVRKFLAEPKRFPLWLQYMVIHFSGMRYQSAHGSWADPRDLLISLTEKLVARELDGKDELVIEALCQEKIAVYSRIRQASPAPAASAEQGELPALVLAENPVWRRKAEYHLKTLEKFKLRVKVTPAESKPGAVVYKESPTGMQATPNTIQRALEVAVSFPPLEKDKDYYQITEYIRNPAWVGLYVQEDDITIIPDVRKRRALLDLRVDEESYLIEEKMNDEQVLGELRAMRDQLELPNWMWNEMVKLTDLRLSEVQDASWENLSDTDQAVRQNYEFREYRKLMDEWKKANLTGWREEHDRANRLVVTRAVCNEVAEHCQHLRGNSPPGGLTAKPKWYQRRERDPSLAKGDDKPYLTKIKSAESFKVGASILWLRFVHEEPNPWRIAHPLVLSDGSGLLTPGLNVGRGDGGGDFDPSKVFVIKNPGPWSYFQDSSGRYRRSRSVQDAKGKVYRQHEWLRWMHEATVAQVGETADGPVVLTFETALPYEDRRRSTIGIFRHNLNWLLYNVKPPTFNGSFIGYTPEGDLPVRDLREMLDWNKILQRTDYPTADQVKAFWDAALGPQAAVAARTRSVRAVDSLVEVAPPLKTKAQGHKESVPVYEADPAGKTVKLYNPEAAVMRIELPRGTRLKVSKFNVIRSGAEQYYLISECEPNPLAQDFYLRAGDALDVPAAKDVIAAVTPVTLPVYTISQDNGAGKPQFTAHPAAPQAQLALPANTRFLISAVHKAAADDPGNGLVTGADGKNYGLVVECPALSSAQGYFVSLDPVEEISLEEYLSDPIGKGAAIVRTIKARVMPRAGAAQAALYKPGPNSSVVKSGVDTLPKGAEVTIVAQPVFSAGAAYYRISAYPSRPAFKDLLVNVEDISLGIDKTAELDANAL